MTVNLNQMIKARKIKIGKSIFFTPFVHSRTELIIATFMTRVAFNCRSGH